MENNKFENNEVNIDNVLKKQNSKYFESDSDCKKKELSQIYANGNTSDNVSVVNQNGCIPINGQNNKICYYKRNDVYVNNSDKTYKNITIASIIMFILFDIVIIGLGLNSLFSYLRVTMGTSMNYILRYSLNYMLYVGIYFIVSFILSLIGLINKIMVLKSKIKLSIKIKYEVFACCILGSYELVLLIINMEMRNGYYSAYYTDTINRIAILLLVFCVFNIGGCILYKISQDFKLCGEIKREIG